MATPQHHFVAPKSTPRDTTVPADHPSATVKRQQLVALKVVNPATTPQASVYQPWTTILGQAEGRYKAELTAALKALEQATTEAGQLLDRAQAMAAEAGASLEAAGWDAWHKYMAAADATRNDILGRARASYDQLLTYAHGQYSAALDDAEKSYRLIVGDANRAKSDAGAIASP